LSHDGRLTGFLRELEDDLELDDHTKDTLAELANDRAFLLAVEDYLYRTHYFH
jgi:hypothetical protein